MNTQWRKIAGDFRQHRLQILLIAAILALGTAGVVAALNARAILAREIEKSYRLANGADVMLWFDKVEPPLLELSGRVRMWRRSIRARQRSPASPASLASGFRCGSASCPISRTKK